MHIYLNYRTFSIQDIHQIFFTHSGGVTTSGKREAGKMPHINPYKNLAFHKPSLWAEILKYPKNTQMAPDITKSPVFGNWIYLILKSITVC